MDLETTRHLQQLSVADATAPSAVHKRPAIFAPRPWAKTIQAIVFRIDGFHLFLNLYGEPFSENIRCELEQSILRSLDQNHGYFEGISPTLIDVEPGEMALVWYATEMSDQGLDLAFLLRSAVQKDMLECIFQQTGHSVNVRVGQATKTLDSSRDMGWETSLSSCLAEARSMSQKNFDVQDMELTRQFQEILVQSHISIVYQPIVDFGNGRLLGWEALSRGPEGSVFHTPLFLFDFAEESGNLFQLESVCRHKAINHCLAHLETGQKLFLNIHPKTLTDPNFNPGETTRILHRAGIRTTDVVFEITEKHCVKDFNLFFETLEHYRKQGFLIAVDDAGAGYSGLLSIARIRPDFIKIDKSLIAGCESDPIKRALLETFVTFANKIGSKIIAEGIEGAETLSCLIDLGVHYGQGFHLCRPDSPPPTTSISLELKHRQNLLSGHRCNLPIKELAQKAQTVGPESTVEHVRNLLDDLGPLASIVVLEAERPIGLLMSYQLDRQLSARYGVALYYKRTVDSLMDPHPLIVDEHSTLESVTQKAMHRDTFKTYDDILITSNGKYLGVVSMQSLIDAMAKFQVEMAKGANPLTGLPGNVALEADVEKRLVTGRTFSLVYADLDNFKIYNDVYGFQSGDQLILLIARILERCQKRYGHASDFLGHVGGDDFVLVTSTADLPTLCSAVLRFFRRIVRYHYEQEDWERGWIQAVGRDGEDKKHSLVSVSLGYLHVAGKTSLTQISERAAEVKKYAKAIPGNSYVCDRRPPLGETP